MNEVFRKFAHTTSEAVGSSGTFIVALAAIVAWVMLGPYFHYSDTWQLVINTATTIVTFLMVFLIRNTQNRDAKAIHLKLDELIRAVQGAKNQFVNLEDLTDEELDHYKARFAELATRARARASGVGDTDCPELPEVAGADAAIPHAS